LSQYVNIEEPRFLALSIRNPNINEIVSFLIFSCPENAAIRMKMIMASAKVTLTLMMMMMMMFT
jgi:hypothetical protein